MQIGMIGLGRMGCQHGHAACCEAATTASSMTATRGDGAPGCSSARPARLRCSSSWTLKPPRAIWLMVPAAAVDALLEPLDAPAGARRHRHRRRQLLLPRSISAPRRELRRDRASRYLDVGTSGGVWRPGARLLPDDRRRRRGRAAPRADVRDARARAIGTAAAPRRAATTTPARPSRAICTAGPPAPGHFVKMVHNGIEYGVMAAYAEGLNILRHANAGKRDQRGRCRDDAAAPTPSTTSTT